MDYDYDEYHRNIITVRAQLDEATFVNAWAEGRAMTLEQAIAEAQHITAFPPTTQPRLTRGERPPNDPTTQFPAGLTAREVEVLRLLARGLTDA